MSSETSMVAASVRLQEWAAQIKECQSRPSGMSVASWCACFLQALFGEKCKIFLENVASPNWRKLQSLDRQLFCQP